MAKVEWTAEAEDRLRQIHDYIAQDKPEAAFHLVEAIYRRVEVLREFPESGHRFWKRPADNVRILLYGHYRIPYRILSSGDVHVLGVFHGAMELDPLLGVAAARAGGGDHRTEGAGIDRGAADAPAGAGDRVSSARLSS